MPRLLISSGQIHAGIVQLGGEDARHLASSLRARVGERIVVVDDAGQAHGVVLEAVRPDRVIGHVEWSRPAGGEPRLHLEVIHALVREFDEVVAGLSQAGVSVIRPVLTARVVSRPDASRAEARVRRWRSIAREAAQLAHRAAVPEVTPLASLDAATAELGHGHRLLACVIGAADPLARIEVDASKPLGVVIGPEGGLDPVEVDSLRFRAVECLHLGPRVLPARIAGTVAASLLFARSGDLDAGGTTPR